MNRFIGKCLHRTEINLTGVDIPKRLIREKSSEKKSI